MTNVVQPISPMILPKITPPPGLALTRRVEHFSTTVKAVSESDPAVYSKTGIVSSHPEGWDSHVKCKSKGKWKGNSGRQGINSPSGGKGSIRIPTRSCRVDRQIFGMEPVSAKVAAQPPCRSVSPELDRENVLGSFGLHE